MRRPVLFAVVAGLFGSSGPVLAQSFPVRASVIVPTVEARSGPTDKFYATSELRRGDSVVVLRRAKDPSWLEIAPPPASLPPHEPIGGAPSGKPKGTKPSPMSTTRRWVTKLVPSLSSKPLLR